MWVNDEEGHCGQLQLEGTLSHVAAPKVLVRGSFLERDAFSTIVIAIRSTTLAV